MHATGCYSGRRWGGVGDPAEVGQIAAFLASDAASYITGQVLYADGGRMALNYVMPPTEEHRAG